jgi:phenylacetic acid degradation operon negative regulatory protein
VYGSVLLTYSMVAHGGEMAVAMARWIFARTTRSGRLRRALARLGAAGAVTMPGGGLTDQRLLRLSAAARLDLLGGVDPEVEWGRPWDGVWRIVAFDLPESVLALRNRLRRRLREHRFGWLQNSVWISPLPVEGFRRELAETGINPENLICLDARPAGGESSAALVNGAWDFAGLAKDYARYREVLRLRPGRRAGSAEKWFQWLGMEHRAWLRVARRDPFLPSALLPPGYPGQRVWAERRRALGEYVRAADGLAGIRPSRGRWHPGRPGTGDA